MPTSPPPHPPPPTPPPPPPDFCRALYDYKATDTSSLSFRKGDILEIVNKLESGWWDGFLGEARGWFPSNYVVVVSNEEVRALGLGLEEGEAMGEGDWLNGHGGGGIDRSTLTLTEDGNDLFQANTDQTETNDFLLPEVTPDGQVHLFFRLVLHTLILSPQLRYST